MLDDRKDKLFNIVSPVSVESPGSAFLQTRETVKTEPAQRAQSETGQSPLDSYREKKKREVAFARMSSGTRVSPLDTYRQRKRQEAQQKFRSLPQIEHFNADSVASLGVGELDFEELRQMAYDGKIKITDPGDRQRLTVSWDNGWNPKYYRQGHKEQVVPIVPKNTRATASGNDTGAVYYLETQENGVEYALPELAPEKRRELLREILPEHQMSGELQRTYVDTLLAFKMGNTEEMQKYARFWEEEQKRREDYFKNREEKLRREYEEWYEAEKKRLEAAAEEEWAQTMSYDSMWSRAVLTNSDHPEMAGLMMFLSWLQQSPNWVALQRHTAPEKKAAKAEMLKSFEKWAKDHGWSASAISIPTSLLSGLDYVMDVYETAYTGAPIPSSLPDFTETTQALRGGVSENFGDTGKFLYNTGMSVTDSWLAGKFGISGLILLGTSAASNAANDIRARGGTEVQALIGGGVAGIFEGLFERYSLGNLDVLKKTPITNVKSFLKNLAKTTFVNASEEGATEIANIAYDTLFNGDISRYSLLMEEYRAVYMEQGMSEADAEKKAHGDVIWLLTGQVLESTVSGALTGVSFMGLNAVENTLRSYKAGRAITENGAQRELLTQALNFPENSNTYQLAEKLGSENRELTSLDAGNLYCMMLLDAEAGNAPATAQGEKSAVQTNLERGIMLAEQQYQEAVEKAGREVENSDIVQPAAYNGALQQQGTAETDFSAGQPVENDIAQKTLRLWEQQYLEAVAETQRETGISDSVQASTATELSSDEQTTESAARSESEYDTIDADTLVQQTSEAIETGVTEPNFTQTELAGVGEALLAAGIMPKKKHLDAMGLDTPRARGIQAVMRMALEDSPARQKAAEIMAKISRAMDMGSVDDRYIGSEIKANRAEDRYKKGSSDSSVVQENARHLNIDEYYSFEKYMSMLANKNDISLSKAISGLPLTGEANTISDLLYYTGIVKQRRVYGPSGKAVIDYDTDDHGKPKWHPTGAHKHCYDYTLKKPHGRAEPPNDLDLMWNSDIIKEGKNYHAQ